MKLNLLTLETSTNICDVSLLSLNDNQVKIYNNSNDTTAKHAEFLFELIEKTLSQANVKRSELDAIVFDQGPGGFTGLRVACGVAQGISFAMGIPVVAVPSLMSVAWQVQQNILLNSEFKSCYHLVIQDARMNEVYVAAYMAKKSDCDITNNLYGFQLHNIQMPILMGINDLKPWVISFLSSLDLNCQLLISGDILSLNPDLIQDLQQLSTQISVGEPLLANANALASLGLLFYKRGFTVQSKDAFPLYVRNKVAFTIAERQSGASGNPSALDQPK